MSLAFPAGWAGPTDRLILIGMESSGTTRDAFRLHGWDAFSCDLLPDERGSPYHFQCDVFELLEQLLPWRMGLFHPTCTFLTGSAEWAYGDGPYHQKVKPETLVGAERREAREKALRDVERLMDAPIDSMAFENPVGAISTRIRKPDQIIQPHQFGEDASKATCLWLKKLPKLRPTGWIAGRMVEWPRGSGKLVERWSNQSDGGQNRLPPSADRWRDRSRTYAGISAAMALQWGAYLEGRY